MGIELGRVPWSPQGDKHLPRCQCGSPARVIPFGVRSYFAACVDSECKIETGTYESEQATRSAWRALVRRRGKGTEH